MVCSSCKCYLPDNEYDYSLKHFGKPLCRFCQKDYLRLKDKQEKRVRKATPEARKLYEILLKNKFNAKLELWDGHKHIDIAIPDIQVNIEVDGKQHQDKKQALSDLKRTFHSFKKGYVTLRIPNILVRENIYETANYIMKFLRESEEQLDEEVGEDF